MDKEELLSILSKIDKITFSKHFQTKLKIRNLTENEVNEILKSPNNIILIVDQGEEAEGHKLSLLLEKSNKYDLKIIISIKDKALNVVTAHIQNKKRRKVFEKWLNQRR